MTTTYRLTIGKQEFLLHLIEEKKTSFGCQSLKARAKVSDVRNETVCRMNKYPIIRLRKDFIEYVMEVLFNQINQN